MILFLPKDIWKNKRGSYFGEPASYLTIKYHPAWDFYTEPVGKVPVIAPCDGFLTTFPFSETAGWWGYFKFDHKEEIYSLRILHMYKQMKGGEYNEGDILGYCGATGSSKTKKYGLVNIGTSPEEQTSDKAVPHLHVELHKGEFQHTTNYDKKLADERIIDPIITFEKWISEGASKDAIDKPVLQDKGSPTQEEDDSNAPRPELKEKKPPAFQRGTRKNKWTEIIDMIIKWLESLK